MAHVLVISPVATHPPQSGARRRIHEMLRALMAAGHRVHLVYTVCEKVSIPAATARMQADWTTVDVYPSGTDFPKSLGEDYGVDDWINPALCTDIPDLVARYGITHCLVNYVFQSAYLDHLPDHVLGILDTHDQLSRREMYESYGLEPGFFYTTSADEMRGLARADILLSIQDNEVDYFSQAGPPVTVVGHTAPVTYLDRRFTALRKIGYVAANNKFNQYAMERFLVAYSDYAGTLPDPPVLHVAGNICRQFEGREEFALPHVVYDGLVADVGDYLGEIDLYVNPTILGTGLKIKSVEALSYGLPVLSTTIGWDGLPALEGYHDAADIDALIAAIDRVRGQGFDGLTRLSNYSKAIFAEYQVNLAANLRTLFDLPTQETRARVRRHPSFIGNRHAENPDFITLEDVPTAPAGPRPRIAHVVNPVRMPRTSDLYVAQPIVYRSMVRARAATCNADVTLVARHYPEDADYMADCFDRHLTLTRSARDLPGFEAGRKLPLLSEVFSLEGLPAETTHVVYTNSDIGLQPQFYDFVADRIAAGCDAIVINRRTLSKRFTTATDLADLQAAQGADHPGFDCFVVSRAVLERSDFADTLVGVHLIGRVVFWNLIAHAARVDYHPAAHLTFHIGDDVPSKGRAGLPYIRHNLLQGAAIAAGLRDDPGGLALPERQTRFDRVLQVSPGEIQGPFDPGTDPRNLVMMHSFFRTGSTYLYRKVRSLQSWTAFYEPFHEDLSIFTPTRIEAFRERHASGKFRHATAKDDKDPWLFAEYEPLLDAGVTGVRDYDRRMSYMIDYDGADAAIARYVTGLVGSVASENVFLQFNRTALRQAQMRALFPQAAHVYLSRGLRDIWGSYLSFRNDAVYGFLRNNLAVLTFNADMPLMQALGAHVPLARMPYMEFFHPRIAEIFHHYTLEQHFLIHATFWHAARRDAARYADLIVDTEQIASNRMIRLETEARLAALQLNVSFRDLSYRRHDEGGTLLSTATMTRLEDLAQRIVAGLDGAGSGEADAGLTPPRHEELQWAAERMDGFRQAARTKKLAPVLEKLARRAARPAARPVPARMDAEHTIDEIAAAGWLRAGFHAPEATHVWGDGHVGALEIGVPEAVLAARQDLDVMLRIHLHPLVATRNGSIDIFAHTRHLASHCPGDTWEKIVVRVTAADLEATQGVLRIGFHVPRIFDGEGLRKRSLSVCLSRIGLKVAR